MAGQNKADEQFKARVDIDKDVVKGLLLVNGGGAASLLLLLPKLIEKSEFYWISFSIFAALFSFHFGLVFALVHSHLRRRCSGKFSGGGDPTKIKNRWIKWFFLIGRNEKYLVCQISAMFMSWSYIAFFIGGVIATMGGGLSFYILKTPPLPGCPY